MRARGEGNHDNRPPRRLGRTIPLCRGGRRRRHRTDLTRAMTAVTRRAALAGMAAVAAVRARAQTAWPDHSVTIVHGLAPGGPSDLIARIIAESLTRRLGQQFVVDARP